MDSSLLTLPAQYAVWIWAPVSLLTLACAAWLAWLLRDEPEAMAVAAVRQAPVAAPRERMPRRRAATPRKLARAQRLARREQAQDRKRPRRPLAGPDYAYA